jgi:uncharacterized repeat protein (TIGR03803 family)
MNRQAFSLFPRRPFLLLIAVLISAGSASAAPANTADRLAKVYRFHGGGDGANPAAGLIADHAGNLYGTTEYGGGSFYGTVFELSPPGKPGGAWRETTLYAFANDGDGARPTAGLIFDQSGNLYGTTSDSAAGGYGEVFRLSPAGDQGGPWTETVLYSFTGGTDGAYPAAGVIFDQAGKLYGTTSSSVFELSPPAQRGGAWTFTLLHTFKCCTRDGWNSLAGLVMDQDGNLYGTTEWGGFYKSDYCVYLGCGTVFKVSPPGTLGGSWKEEVLYRFTGDTNGFTDGFVPFAGITLDHAGNLYGTTYSGGTLGGGTVFQLAPPAQRDGTWTETILHNFSYSATDGAAPVASLIFDQAGNLYSTARFGGNSCYFNGAQYGCGVVFELSPPAGRGGTWTENVLYFFRPGHLAAPQQPSAGLLFTKDGNLLGTTTFGGHHTCTDDGSDTCGTVYRINQ